MASLRNKQLINKKAEFFDDNLEGLYYEQQISTSKHYIRHIILAVGVLYMALSVVDFYRFGGSLHLQIFIARLVVFLFALISWHVINSTKVITVACACITFFPPTLCFAGIYISYQTQNQSFAYQAMSIMVIIFCTTLMPNRWANLVFIDLLMPTIFLIVTPFYIKNIPLYDYAAVLFFLVITLLFAIAAQYRSNLNQREKFLREKQLETQSITDTLTGLYNRLWFDMTLADWCSNLDKEQTFSLVLLDIDDFKKVNDTFGHPVGDSVLVESTSLLRSSIRSTDMLARWGGEEFALLLPGANLNNAVELTEQLRVKIKKHQFTKVGKVTCSFGVVAHKKGQSAESMLQEVDKYLYTAKADGKNCVRYPKQ